MAAEDQNIDPEEMMMRANLREFGQRIAMVCALEEGGKVTTEEAFDRIKYIWKKLKRSKKNLIHDHTQIDQDIDTWYDNDFPFQDPEDDDGGEDEQSS